jgi:transcriptional regulator with XRE-family HTH domain
MLGQKLVNLRTTRGLTQEQLSKMLKMSRSTYAQYEVDRRIPDAETIKVLATFFNVTTDYLLDHKADTALNPNESHGTAQISTEPYLTDLLKKVPDLTDEEKESLEEHMQFALKIIEKERARRAAAKK